MTDLRRPRKGSLAFRPRKRAGRLFFTPEVWPEVSEKAVLGFVGFKAGMTSVGYLDESNSPTKGNEVITAATVVETPPMIVYGIRAYNGGRVWDEYTEDKEILKTLKAKKLTSSNIPIDQIKEVRLLAYAQPRLTGIGMKHVLRCELGVGGKDLEEKLEFARSLIGKTITVDQVFKPGMFLDVVGVTKGKGWQGEVKRFGVSLQRPKATGRRRHVGTLGPWHPAYVMYTVPRAGQTGFHKRTELNKWLMHIGNAEELKTFFDHYGVVKNQFMIVKGSLPGTPKRPLAFRRAIRRQEIMPVKLTYAEVMA
jgi:large subunit ribosomal protein L3